MRSIAVALAPRSRRTAAYDALLEIVAELPVHLKVRLCSSASVWSPLTDAVVRSLLGGSALAQLSGAAEAPTTWDAPDVYREVDEIDELVLAYSSVTLSTLRAAVLVRPPPMAVVRTVSLVRLDISHCPCLALSAPLITVLASLPLQSLALAHEPNAPPHRFPFVMRLAEALPALRELDLSHNTWLVLQDLAGVDWSRRWMALKRLHLRGFVAPPTHEEQMILAQRQAQPRAGQLSKCPDDRQRDRLVAAHAAADASLMRALHQVTTARGPRPRIEMVVV